jgi:16S rRNA (guanine966-N2)-methyltransferase
MQSSLAIDGSLKSLRIIAGTAKGRMLKMPRKDTVRPTADRVKETIFNILGQWLDGERVLDLYAGAGSLGLEALSRGALHATFVERDPDVMLTLAENVKALGFALASTTLLKPMERAVRTLGSQAHSFSLVLADPPYAALAGESILRELDAAGVMPPGARLVLEHDRRETVPLKVGQLEQTDERRFGDTLVSFYVMRAPETDPAA